MDATAMHARNMPAMDFDTVTGATDTSATTTTTKSATTTPATTTPATTMPAAGLDTIMEGDGHEIAEDNVVAHPNGSVPEQAPGFQLMSLPTELRLMILKEFLQMPRPILFKNSIYVGDRYPSKYVRRPAPFSIVRDRPASVEWFHVAGETITIQQKDMFRIFRVSKTIYMETVPLYFSKNTFAFDNLDLFAFFADKMSTEDKRTASIKSITSVDIKWYGEATARAAQKLLKFEGLRNLTIRIVSASVARVTKDRPYEMTLYGMQHLLKIRGLENLQLKFPERLSCRRKGSPEEVRNGQCNLAEGKSRELLEKSLEVLKQEKTVTNKVRGQKTKNVGAVATKMDQKA